MDGCMNARPCQSGRMASGALGATTPDRSTAPWSAGSSVQAWALIARQADYQPQTIFGQEHGVGDRSAEQERLQQPHSGVAAPERQLDRRSLGRDLDGLCLGDRVRLLHRHHVLAGRHRGRHSASRAGWPSIETLAPTTETVTFSRLPGAVGGGVARGANRCSRPPAYRRGRP